MNNFMNKLTKSYKSSRQNPPELQTFIETTVDFIAKIDYRRFLININ